MIEAALDSLAPELTRLDALIEREIKRLRGCYELSLDEFRGLYVSDWQVDELVRARSGDDFALADSLVSFVKAARGADEGSRWAHVARVFGLSDEQRDVLLALLAPEIDPKYEALYAYLNNDVTRKWPTAELVGRLFGRDRPHRVSIRGLLAPDSTLVSSRTCEPCSPAREVPRAQRGWRVNAALANWLCGLPYCDDRLEAYVRPARTAPVVPLEWLGLPSDTRIGTASLADISGGGLALVVTASTAPEALFAAEQLLAREPRVAMILDLTAIRSAPAPGEVFASAELLQRVLNAVLVAAPLDALTDPEGRAIEAVAIPFRRMVRESPTLVLGAARGIQARDLLGDLPVLEIPVADPGAPARAALWSFALGKDHPAVVPLADRFAFGAARILEVVTAARAAGRLLGRASPDIDDLFRAAQQASAQRAGRVTRSIASPFGWDDLILPIPVKRLLRDVLRAIELRSRVLDAWGFAERVGCGHGVRILFAGASGTGKTMAAAILARELRLELHRVELAQVCSKYIGETEKNLDAAFDAARRANAVLFIDEAEALLGKRSEVKDAHDRYANVEIAYLLQKMEDHDGIVILATNLAQNIDAAFTRRMQYVVEFPMPDAANRELLWRRMIPPDVPLDADVDFGFLARQFELAGGDIRNIVLDAAYAVAHEESALSLVHVLRAIARHYAKRGRVPTVAEYREHFGLLATHSQSEAIVAPASLDAPGQVARHA